MKRKSWPILLLVLAVAVALFATLPQASSQSIVPQLRLHRGTFDATAPNLAKSHQTDQLLAPAAGPYAIVQFRGPITPADQKALADLGLETIEYVPDFAYIVKGTADQLAKVAELKTVYAQIPLTLADKVSPAFLEMIQMGRTELGLVYVVSWDANSDLMAADFAQLPFDINGNLTVDQLLSVAALESVRWIEPRSTPRLLNDYARNIGGVNSVWQSTAPLYGTGQVVAVADTGLDTGNLGTLSTDFSGRVIATHVLAPDGDWADQHGHGTHVFGSIAGNGALSGSNPAAHNYTTSFAGVAPEANIVVQGFEVGSTGIVTGIPEDYYLLYAQAYNDGARIHSNSWGDTTGPITDTAAAYGGYPYGAQRTDAFIWDHPDMAIFVAAGNSGRDGAPGALGFCTGGNGVVDPDSLLTPGTAKNVITVGASESNRSTGGAGGSPWMLLNLCFGTQPIATDTIANNINGMAAFSSRGPTDDGRVKPDIVFPGTNIVSSRSHNENAGTLWGVHELNPDYVYSGGTSMATPLTAGLGALARQWLTLNGATNPSAALLKAVLLNTTESMGAGQYGTGTTREIPANTPNTVNGWGRADIGFIVPPNHYKLWFDDHTAGLNSSDSVTYNHTTSQPLTVLNSTQPLRVMLVWTDPAASLSASAQLVNDLDLVVTGPGGEIYRGNAHATGDRVNNVEGVIINNPPTGVYQVTVTAFNVPVSSQPYALVVSGPFVELPTPTPTATNTPTPTNTPTITPTPTNTPTITPTPTPSMCNGSNNVRINFQPANIVPPAGYLIDSGSVYGTKPGGCTYGWSTTVVTENRQQTHPGSVAPNIQHYTLAYMQNGSTNAYWEMAVPNGLYMVHLVAGDAGITSQTAGSNIDFAMAIEGGLWLEALTTNNQRWVSGGGVVYVSDGRLTINNHPGSSGNRLNFVHITRLNALPTGFRAKVNFQPLNNINVPGYLIDHGAAFGIQNSGYAYGWSQANNNSAYYNTNQAIDQRYSTLLYMQDKTVNYTWEMELPNGTYVVHLVAGDPLSTDGDYRIAAEGVTAINGIPISTLRALENTVVVTVTDGRLTLSNLPNSVYNRLNFVEIIQVNP